MPFFLISFVRSAVGGPFTRGVDTIYFIVIQAGMLSIRLFIWSFLGVQNCSEFFHFVLVTVSLPFGELLSKNTHSGMGQRMFSVPFHYRRNCTRGISLPIIYSRYGLLFHM